MEIKAFEVEEWMNKYEDDAKYNIAETCVESLKVGELLNIASIERDEFFGRLAETKLTYGVIPGSAALRDPTRCRNEQRRNSRAWGTSDRRMERSLNGTSQRRQSWRNRNTSRSSAWG